MCLKKKFTAELFAEHAERIWCTFLKENCNQRSVPAVWHKKQSELFSISASEMQHMQKNRFDATVELNKQKRVRLFDLIEVCVPFLDLLL